MKKKRWGIGDVFQIELSEKGAYSLGQVTGQEPEVLNSVTCAFFNIKLNNEAGFSCDLLSFEKVFSILFCTRDLLDSGRWKVISKCPVCVDRRFFPYENLRADGWIGAEVVGSGIVNSFVNAFFGLEPWDDWADSGFLDSLLLSPQKKPQNLVYKRML